jgi:hypothetical protein
MTSPDGINWTIRTTPSTTYTWQAITFGNGLFVAVAQSGYVMTSPDGITWTIRSSAASNSWVSVVYGNGLFVAVAGGAVMTSPDGITWTSKTAASSASWVSVAYGNGIFASIATTVTSVPKVMTSIGATSTPASNQISITFTTSSSTDIASTTILRSTSPITDVPQEGVNYATSTTIGASTVACSLAVVASTTYTCIVTGLTNGTPYYFKIFTEDATGNYSQGVNLPNTPLAPGGNTTTLGVGNDPLSTTVAPGSSATTSDTFTFQTTSGTDVVQSVTVALAASTSQGLSLVEITDDSGSTVYGSVANPSSDTPTITLNNNTLTANTSLTQYRIRITPKSHASMPAVPGAIYSVTSYVSSFIPTAYAQIGSDIGGATTTIINIDNASPADVDTAGITWRSRVSALGTTWYSVTYGNGLFVAVSSTSTDSSVMTSPDGITWTTQTGTSTNNWRSVTYGNGLFVAVSTSGSGNRVMTSPDGITWTPRTSAADNAWTSITYGNGLFVAVSTSGVGNEVMTSPDGITWTSRTDSTDSQWYSITYGNGMFVAVSLSGIVMTSPDGITWTSRTPTVSALWVSVAYGNGLFVAVSYSSAVAVGVMTSPDGITWTARTSTGSNQWFGVAYGNNLFVAVSNNGSSRIMTSPDGITWTPRTMPASNAWQSITYGNGLFVAIACGINSTACNTTSGNHVMTSNSATTTPSSTQIPITFTVSSDTDVATSTILRSTSPITDTPQEGTNYSTSTTIGASTVVCSFTVTASSTRTCTATGLTNGTPYYFKLFLEDSSGNWSAGVNLPNNPVSPGATTVTLGVGTDTPSVSLSPGASATTSDTFTFQTSSGTDVIQSAVVTMATSTATSTSLVEITSDNGSTVYGSVANPTSDTFTVTLSNNTLTANTTLTQYRVRITPKSHANMPVPLGATYYVTSFISSFVGTSAATTGSDLGGSTSTVITIDNESPLTPYSVTARKTSTEQIIISYTSATSTDAQDTLITRSLSNATDTPVEGTNYVAGNTIGASTVLCVASSTPLGGAKTCTYTNPSRSINYYFKLFTKDSTGNYSLSVSPTGGPWYIPAPTSGGTFIIEREAQNGATTTVSGGTGNRAGGYGDTGTTTNSTTTVATTTPTKGGGGGDSGFLYFKNNLATLQSINATLSDMIEVLFTSGTYSTYALGDEVAAPENVYRCAIFKVPFLEKYYIKYSDLKKGCDLTYPPSAP